MNITIRLACGIAFLFVSQIALSCDYPSKISLVNGTTASKEEMIEAQKGVKSFVSDMEAYLACILEEEKQARDALEELSPEDEQQREGMLNKKYNAAVEEMEKVAAQFNAEVQAYKDRDNS